ncbi:MAG: thiamine pyrophosphate-requiring protein [Solirubrobacterales bacterium]|nr:thiamine pyrophosphate-requiring protein [Solirubrobacterales bacterium]
MSQSVADYLLDRLATWGIRRIYGYPGDGINGIMGAFERATQGHRPSETSNGGPAPEFIQVRHEEMAAFMACAHAKFTGELGVCMATSGPGAVHLLNGLYDAKLDHQPVVAIVGQQARAGLGGHYQQEIDLDALFKDVAGEYVQVAMEPTQIRHLVDRACRIALAERTVTAIIIPNDVQESDAVEQPPHVHGTVHSGPGYRRPRVLPHDEDLSAAAEVLNAGERVAMLVGQGALGAGSQVEAVAEVLGAGVAKALLGKAVLPDDLPYVTGSIGLLGTKPSWTLMQECDTLLMVGSSFPYSEFLPEEGQARGVQIDLDGRMIGIRYPMEVNLVGDAAETLGALLPLLDRKEDRGWREKLEGEVREWWELIEHRAQLEADPVNPQLVFHELSKRLPDGAIVSSDSGSAANWFARDIRLRQGMMASLSGTLATMGPGVPYAIAAKFAHPQRPVIALVGDGAMQMNGINELITIAKYHDRWANQRLIVLVLNNRDLNQVTWEQRAMSGDPKFEGSQDLPDFPYARYAEMLGLKGIRVDRPEQIASAWDEALAADRPVVYEAVTDPEVPPLPPHITLEQAKALSSALLAGDPNAGRIVKQAFVQKAQEFLPGR